MGPGAPEMGPGLPGIGPGTPRDGSRGSQATAGQHFAPDCWPSPVLGVSCFIDNATPVSVFVAPWGGYLSASLNVLCSERCQSLRTRTLPEDVPLTDYVFPKSITQEGAMGS